MCERLESTRRTGRHARVNVRVQLKSRIIIGWFVLLVRVPSPSSSLPSSVQCSGFYAPTEMRAYCPSVSHICIRIYDFISMYCIAVCVCVCNAYARLMPSTMFRSDLSGRGSRNGTENTALRAFARLYLYDLGPATNVIIRHG